MAVAGSSLDRWWLADPGERYWLEDWRGELYSRVEDRETDRLLIALPSDGVTVHTLAIGREVTLEWLTARGVARMPGLVQARTRDSIPILSIEIVGETRFVQRRDYARADLYLPVDVTP